MTMAKCIDVNILETPTHALYKPGQRTNALCSLVYS